MSDETIKKLEQRVTDLESKIKVKKERKTREPSEYNKFMKDFISKNKDPKKTHPELFAEAAKAWGLKKKAN
jgi:hypothetical protein